MEKEEVEKVEKKFESGERGAADCLVNELYTSQKLSVTFFFLLNWRWFTVQTINGRQKLFWHSPHGVSRPGLSNMKISSYTNQSIYSKSVVS